MAVSVSIPIHRVTGHHSAHVARRKTILRVENDETIRELIGMVLMRAGYAVRSVADGVEAVRACLNTIPELVISDVHMPRMDGFEFVESLRKNEGTKKCPGHLPDGG